MIPTSRNGRNLPEGSGKVTVSGRKAPEINGKWKQYSRPEDRGVIPATFGCFPSSRTGI
jgi:hypothetical protein